MNYRAVQTSIAAVGFCFMAGVVSFAAHAADTSSYEQKVISTRGHDLKDVVEVQGLEQRIQAAARQVCEAVGLDPFVNVTEFRSCAKHAAQDGMVQLSQIADAKGAPLEATLRKANGQVPVSLAAK